MSSAATIRLQIEAELADRIPSALTPDRRVIRPVVPTGVMMWMRFWRAACRRCDHRDGWSGIERSNRGHALVPCVILLTREKYAPW